MGIEKVDIEELKKLVDAFHVESKGKKGYCTKNCVFK